MHYFLMRLFALDLRIEKTGEVDYSIVIVIIPITDGIDRIDKRLASVKMEQRKSLIKNRIRIKLLQPILLLRYWATVRTTPCRARTSDSRAS